MRTYTMIERGGGWEALRGHYSRWHRSAMPARCVRMCILASTRAAIHAGEVDLGTGVDFDRLSLEWSVPLRYDSLPAWEAWAALETRCDTNAPRRAVEALEGWLAGKVTTEEWLRVGQSATDATLVADNLGHRFAARGVGYRSGWQMATEFARPMSRLPGWTARSRSCFLSGQWVRWVLARLVDF